MRRKTLILFAGILFGCGSGTKLKDGGDGGSPPNVCSNGEQRCEGMNLKQCKNGGWATETCDHVCQQSGLGPATSCKHDPTKGYESCFCAAKTGACQEGEQRCSGLNLSVCEGGAWSTSTCQTLCQQGGLGKAESCGYDAQKGKEICYCASSPPACQDGEQKCSGMSINTCSGGKWQTDACDSLCHQGGFGKAESCSYSAQKGKEICFCYDGAIGDPCTSSADCTQGSCGTGGWCTQTCSHDSECGKSTAGNTNYCMQTTSGNGACFPYCSSGTMCADYPGTQCQQGVQTKDGSVVDGVCTL